MLKRLLLSLVVAATVFGVTTAFAAGFNAQTTYLGEAHVTVASCAQNVKTSYVLDTVDPTRVAKVHVEILDQPPNRCGGAEAHVVLSDATPTIIGSGVLTDYPDSGKADVPITTTPLPRAGDVVDVRVVFNGP